MRVGIVGCGGMGGVHANKYALMPDVELSVFDVDTAKAESFCAARNIKRADSLSDLLRDCEAADVCLPTPVHREVAIKCLRAGRPTLVEKPMARSMADCQAMIAESKSSGSMLVPAHVVRFFPEFRAAHDVIAAGKIGVPASIRLRRGGGAPKAEWFLDVDQSGGILLDLAVHEFDWLNWTLGRPKLVTSRSVRLGDRVKDADFRGDYALTTISYDNGCVAHVESTWMDPAGFKVTIEACGSGGAVEYDSSRNPTLRVAGGATENNYLPTDDPYYKQLRAFVDAATGKTAPAVTAEEGLLAVQVAEAAVTSARTGKPIAL